MIQSWCREMFLKSHENLILTFTKKYKNSETDKGSERRELPCENFEERYRIEFVEWFADKKKKKKNEKTCLEIAKSKEWNCQGWNSPKSHNRRTWSIGHDLTRKFRHVRIDRCISVHGLFPFNPAALQVREELVSRGTALCYRANLATERPPAEPALPCLSTHPPIYSSTRSHTQRRIYEYIYIYTYIQRQVGRAHPPT